MRITQPDIWCAKQGMPVQTKEHILDLLRGHQRELQRLGVRRCGLFGSFARNEAQAGSDVDMLVEFEPDQKTFDHFMQLALFLSYCLRLKRRLGFGISQLPRFIVISQFGGLRLM